MVFEDFIDIKSPLTEEDLDKIDKLSQKAKRVLDKAQKQKDRMTSGIFGGGGTGVGGRTLPKGFERPATIGTGLIAGRSPLTKDDFRKETYKKGFLEKILSGELGTTHANEALNFFKDPTNFAIGLFTKTLPQLAGLVAFIDTVRGAIEYLTQPGMPLDIYFKDTITNLVNALRAKQVQQQVRLGYTQLIIAGKTGLSIVKDSYNTYHLAETNKQELERAFMVRYPIGY